MYLTVCFFTKVKQLPPGEGRKDGLEQDIWKKEKR